MATYEPVIGFEVHTELSTATKIFCGCDITYGAPPNTQVCPICLGMPGVLPVLNRQAIEYTIRTAIALNCEITERTVFDRKNYYYPDLPKNYQISQNYASLGLNGYVDLDVNGTTKRVRINNVHLEEDAGKLIHPDIPGADYSLVDLNRAGTALIEIVSEPDIDNADEALAYMQTLKNLLEYIEVSDCKMQEGRLRFEVNISVREVGTKTLGTKVEIKNLNSMKTALKCIEYETRRQSDALNRGEKIIQETRLWDEAVGATRAMRSKEDAHDYRYFPDPDLVEVHITPEWREEVRAHLPELQDAKRRRFVEEYGLPEYDARVLTSAKKTATYYEHAVAAHKNPKSLSNWMMTEVLRELNARDVEADEFPLKSEGLASIVRMIDEGKISGKIAKDVFAKAVETGRAPEEIVQSEGLLQVSDTGEIEKFVDEAIAENPDMVAKIQGGNAKTIQALVGQVMKKSRGKANPALVNELINRKLQS
ncbi:MAG: Asp-tRNA(Asn)/Glu-tRNA(Gln) amidotransferase subunit GatB [Candidatus Sumerlaeaceae bacterium]|nr:Asp-tRNA(Asn)/Glu-tRNA(Gln) amidotransferase subunit GatB [Candidatus Sumerlaeaceae bacterium]